MALPNVEVCYMLTPFRFKDSLCIEKKDSCTLTALLILNLYAGCEFDKLINPKRNIASYKGGQFGFRFEFN
jgi:hypothetical protein